VDQTRFQEAQKAYDDGDFRGAAKMFLGAAGRGAEGNGAAYHKAGNSLIHLRRYQDAVTVYGHALRDSIYDKRGAVFANIGAAYASLGDYAESVRAYQSALAEPDYATPYKAYQGMANSLLERGSVEEAAIAFRKGALEPGNPDPGKALVNLGLCFMALGRPADAVEAYQAALGFDQYNGRGKALSNLGQAYLAMGNDAEAVKAFDKSTQLHGHKLSPTAQTAYDDARFRVQPAPREVVEGWQTGELPQVIAVGASAVVAPSPLPAPIPAPMPARAPAVPPEATLPVSDPAAAPVAPMQSSTAGDSAALEPHVALYDVEAAHDFDALPPEAAAAASALGMGNDQDIADFFSVTDEQLKERDRDARREGRSKPGKRGGAGKTLIVLGILVVLAVGLLGGAYALGFGFPTQEQTVSGLLGAHTTGDPVVSYWIAVTDKDVRKEMAKIPPLTSFVVDGVTMHTNDSVALVTVTPKTGAPLHYTLTLRREGVGWKVTGVENDWRSTGGS
jgi:tetratricopeptide (TPR) repeat protein